MDSRKALSVQTESECCTAQLKKLLSGLLDVAEIGFECKDKEGTRRMCHVALGSYCCDIPEDKDMTCVLQGIKTCYCCLRCYVTPDSLSSFSSEPSRLLQHTQDARLRYNSLRSEVAELRASGRKTEVGIKEEPSTNQLSDICVTDQVSFLESFPFVNTVPFLDLYALFVFEPMHNFHLGISKPLKIAVSSKLTSKTHFTRCTRNGQPRTFSAMRTAILNGANHILACIDDDSPVRGLQVDFLPRAKGNVSTVFSMQPVLSACWKPRIIEVWIWCFHFLGCISTAVVMKAALLRPPLLSSNILISCIKVKLWMDTGRGVCPGIPDSQFQRSRKEAL